MDERSRLTFLNTIEAGLMEKIREKGRPKGNGQ